MKSYAADLAAVREAAGRIDGVARRTPVMTCSTLDGLAGRSLFLKCENFQKIGAFKIRGAANAILGLPEGSTSRGIVTQSSGNHAQAVAFAARLRGAAAHIVMPRTAASIKMSAVREYGARIIPCEPTLASREETARGVLEETGGVMIPPYDHPDIIAGQGTVALELLDQAPDLDAIVAPVGGGGLISGICLAAREIRPSLRVFGAEPAGADDAARSKAAGKWIPQDAPRTIADGLLTSLGELTWPVVRDLVHEIVTVGEEEIVRAMRLLAERAKLLVEPSAAVAAAAVLSETFRMKSGLRNVGVVLSGGNVDLDNLPW